MNPSPKSATILLIACACLWSTSGCFIKFLNANGSGVSGDAIAFYRSAIGGIALLPLAWKNRASLQSASPAWLAGSVLSFTVMTVCFVIATTQTAAANAIILQNTAPVWVFLLSVLLLKESPRPQEFVYLALSLLGVAVILGNPRSSSLAGSSIALLSGLGYGSLTVMLRGLRSVSPLVVVCMNCLGSALLLLVPVILNHSYALTPGQAGVLIGLSLGQFALPYLLYSWGLQHVNAPRASLIVLLEILLNPLWTYLFIGEAVPTPALMGGPLILLGVLGAMLSRRRAEVGSG